MEELFRVGVISNTHGIRGEVKVYPTTDNVRRFDDLKEVIKNLIILMTLSRTREWIYLLQERMQFLWKRENIT